MSESRHFLDRIPVQPPEVPRKPPRKSVSACLEQHTLDFITAEAEAKNMTPGAFIRHICELLESGEF
jgi:hypothetical protein